MGCSWWGAGNWRPHLGGLLRTRNLSPSGLMCRTGGVPRGTAPLGKWVGMARTPDRDRWRHGVGRDLNPLAGYPGPHCPGNSVIPAPDVPHPPTPGCPIGRADPEPVVPWRALSANLGPTRRQIERLEGEPGARPRDGRPGGRDRASSMNGTRGRGANARGTQRRVEVGTVRPPPGNPSVNELPPMNSLARLRQNPKGCAGKAASGKYWGSFR